MNGNSILFLDKVFLGRKEKQICGVEVFNLNLIRDLARLGWQVAVPVHSSWSADVHEWTRGLAVETVETPFGSSNMPGVIGAVLKLRRRRFGVLLLANVGDRLMPAMALVRRLGMAARSVLIAHREPSARFVSAAARSRVAVLAVNGKIAAHFTGTAPRLGVWYGITDAERFHPPADGTSGGGLVNFCVVGNLDRKWKGADTALEAFRALPDAVRTRCCLHLAAYSSVPAFDERNIMPYAWMPFERIPEFLRGMDVMLVPSRDEEVMRETFSQAAVQGMLTGLPLIVNDLPVLVEKVDRGGGLAFRSVRDLADAMARLAADSGLRKKLGTEARQIALARYVWNSERFAREFLAP